MGEINEILNVIYYIEEDITNIITNNEEENKEIKKIMKKLNYVYQKVKHLEKTRPISL